MALLVATLAGACTLAELQYAPRSYALNLGTANLREDVILLNIVRASRFEPMNFVALSKYTAIGNLQASMGYTQNQGLNYEVYQRQATTPITTTLATSAITHRSFVPSLTAATNNSFDMAPLDNSDFYTNFMRELTIVQLNLLLNAGLSREVVLHALVKSVRGAKTRPGAKTKEEDYFEYVNDPWNDTYSDFLAFLNGIVDLGISIELYKDDSAAESGQKGRNNASVKTTGIPKVILEVQTDPKKKEQSADKRTLALCFDVARARKTNILGQTISAQKQTCNRHKNRHAQLDPAATGPLDLYIADGNGGAVMNLVLRSPYAVFQYFGTLLREGKGKTPILREPSARRKTGDEILFTVINETGNCFADVSYEGQNYCVPKEGAENTKEIFSLLIALVNLSTTRGSLPTTPTVTVNP